MAASLGLSPTDTMSPTAPAELLMTAAALMSLVTMLLVAARAVNVLR